MTEKNNHDISKEFSNELVKYVKEGAPNVSSNDYAARLDACQKCPHLIPKHMRCGLCGCMIQHKAKWKTTSCPDDPPRWAPQNHTPNVEE